MKGKERENSTFVYPVSAEGAWGRGNRGRRMWGEVVALGVFCPIGLVCFRGKRIKGETETERDRAINIAQAAECRAKEALKGVGTQTSEGGMVAFLWEETQRVFMLL